MKFYQTINFETVINNSTAASRSANPYFALPTNGNLDYLPPLDPYCFVANTDCFSFVMDTGANWFIVNNQLSSPPLPPSPALSRELGAVLYR
jgi:hypothetical protein